MNRIANFITALASAAALFASSLPAQVPGASTSGQAASAGTEVIPGPKLADVESALAAIEADTRIEGAVRDVLRARYIQAVDELKKAADSATKTGEYREAIKTAPERAAESCAELEALPLPENAAKVAAIGGSEGLQKDIDSRRAVLNGLNGDLLKITSELARVKARPIEISARLPEAQRELSEMGKRLASPELAENATSASRVADRILLQAAQSKLLSELEMLGQEQLSQSVREDLLQAQQELLSRQVENAEAALGTLDELLHNRLESEVQHVGKLTDMILGELPEADGAAKALAAEVQSLAKEFEYVVENLKKVKVAQDDVRARLKGLTEEHETIREQLNLGGGGGAMVQVLFDLRRQAYDARTDLRTAQLPTFDATRLASFEAKEKLRGQREVERQFADRSSEAVARLVTARRDVLERLGTQYGNLTRTLAELEGEKRQYLDKADEVLSYISEQLFGFGLRSCPPVSVKTVSGIPGGLQWVFRGEHWSEVGRSLRGMMTSMPMCLIGMLVVVAMLLTTRHWIGDALERTGAKIRRISTDRYAHTGQALVWTSLLAVPIPLSIGFVGWAMGMPPGASDWMRGVTYGLQNVAWITAAAMFMVEVCRPDGLGMAHFGWRKETLARFRSAILGFMAVYAPALLLTSSCTFGDASRFLDSVGRSSFILAHAWAAIVLWQLFRGSGGIFATLTHEHPTHFMTRWRYVWFSLALACPIALVAIAWLGYLVTAIELSLGLLVTLVLIASGSVLCGMALRWFTMNQRKLALAEALERRRARQEVAASGGPKESTGEVVSVDPEDEGELDLDAISDQTRTLLRVLFSLGVSIAVIAFWSGHFPLIAAFETISIPLTGGLTLLGLTQALLILVVMYIAVQNLPGLLELAVLRATTIEAGTRNAITTLCRYAVIAIGFALLFGVLHVDWAKFGWIAAALSVGIGFGLQEVVANFVCGLILLFERPIRVGDVVTVEGMTGTVTKIHLRATTITNWDRQEFVVPNKSLITGAILNWTLSAPLSRILIPVGVAYGSDTEKARQILLDVAADHPRILDDPPPMATFEQFADSSLNLVLRAYIPDLENRMGTITELHTEINKRFATAGIEIAFPQRDLHIRSGWTAPSLADSGGAEDR